MSEELCIVDAFNVIHSWPELRLLMRRSLDVAGARLIDRARVLHDSAGVSMSFVFDGTGDRVSIESIEERDTLSRVYAPRGVSADAVIEMMVGRAADPARIVVVTRDGAIALSVEAAGARCINPELFIDWIGRVERQQQGDLAARRRAAERAWGGLFDA